MWTYRERRNRAAFSNAQLAYDRAVDPLWDQPDPEPEPEDEQEDFERYTHNAETAVRRALRQHRDANVSIGEYGEVHRHDGRTTQIQ